MECIQNAVHYGLFRNYRVVTCYLFNFIYTQVLSVIAKKMHRLVEESVLSACSNFGKNVIQQCLQQEVLPLDGTKRVLSGACQALAEDLLKSVQLRIWENGCVTQKEVLSYACRGLAKLIKTQCPRGPGEMARMQRDLEYVLSEGSLAIKLAEVINTRELVECVCSQHEDGLRTVLLAACQWLINDIKALFLCEEVWNNFFGDESMVCAEFYTQLRPLLSAMIFQIKIETNIKDSDSQKTNVIEDAPQTHHKSKGTLNTKKQYVARNKSPREPVLLGKEGQQKQTNYGAGHKSVFHGSNYKGSKQPLKEAQEKYYNTGQYFHHCQNSSILIINRETQVSYIIELINTKVKERCYAAILKSWRLLTKNHVSSCTEQFEGKLYYLITFGRHPLNSVQLLSLGDFGDNAFEADVKLQEIGRPIWPKDISVIKRWFPDSFDHTMKETEDPGNQCLQIWRIGSQKIDKRRPKTISSRVIERGNGSIKSYNEPHVLQPKSTTGCFNFSKSKQNLDDY